MDRDDERIHRKEEEISTQNASYGISIMAIILTIGVVIVFINGLEFNWSIKDFLTALATKTNNLKPMNELLNFDNSLKAINNGYEQMRSLYDMKVNSIDSFFKATGIFFKGIYNFIFGFAYNLILDFVNLIVGLFQNITILFQIITLTN